MSKSTANPFPVMTTVIVILTGSQQREQGFPVMKTGSSLWEFTTQGKPCIGLQWDQQASPVWYVRSYEIGRHNKVSKAGLPSASS